MWTCPNCGITININPGNKKIICSCQSYTNKDKPKRTIQRTIISDSHSPLPDTVDIHRSSDLIDICGSCPQYMGGHRCKLIDLGCRRTFNNHLRRLDCPLQKWQNIEQNTINGV